MGSYAVIAAIDEYLKEILADGLVPELLQDRSEVGLCSPPERGDTPVSIYLYDIRENEAFRVSGMVNHSLESQSYQPTYLSLYYMITVWGAGDIRFRAVQEHRIMGRILQLLKDQNLWESSRFGNDDAPNIRVEYLDLPVEEKVKTWTFSTPAYRASLFFRVGPVCLDSEKVRGIRRVLDVDMRVKEEGANG